MPEPHPGMDGIEVERGRRGPGVDFSTIHLIMHLAVASHADMPARPPRSDSVSLLDDIAARDARIRTAGQQRLRITPELAADHNFLVRELATALSMSVEETRNAVGDNVAQYTAYVELAKAEWSDIASMRFDAHTIGVLSRSRYNLVAVANALCLTMAEALVYIRDLRRFEMRLRLLSPEDN